MDADAEMARLRPRLEGLIVGPSAEGTMLWPGLKDRPDLCAVLDDPTHSVDLNPTTEGTTMNIGAQVLAHLAEIRVHHDAAVGTGDPADWGTHRERLDHLRAIEARAKAAADVWEQAIEAGDFSGTEEGGRDERLRKWQALDVGMRERMRGVRGQLG